MVGPPTRSVTAADAPLRVVVLGASNLALSFPTVVAAVQRALRGPLQILATPGHGRSYGLSTQFLGRRLPSIMDCGLWEELARQPSAPTVALLTDIGNDLAYEVPLVQLVQWIETCLARLDAAGASVVITSLPMESLRRIPPYRFRFLRRLLFPRNRTPLDTLLRQAAELNAHIERLGREGRGRVVELPGSWYGLDPIHIRRSMRQAAWKTILAPLALDSSPLPWPALTRRQRKQLRRLRPQERTFFGRVQLHVQPAARWDDGTTVAIY